MKAGGGCPNSVALFNAFLEHGSFEEGETTYIVNLGRDNIDMAVQRDGELLFARNMAGGGGLFTEAIMSTFGLKEGKAETNKLKKGDLTPKAQARYPDSTSEKVANAMQGPAGQLVSMIQSTVMICRAQTKIPDLNIDRLLLTGGGARMKGIRAYFQQSMSVPVEIFDPVDELDVSGLHPDDANELGEHPLDFAVAVGLAETLLRGTSKKLEVLTESAKKKRYFLERTIWTFGAAAAALLLVVLLFQTRGADIELVQTANARLTAEHQQFKVRDEAGQAAAAKELDARLKEVTLRSRRINGTFALAIFELLEKKHPDKYFYIRRVHIEPERVALDLDGIPILKGAGRVSDEGPIKRIHHQMVWPKCEVLGVVQKEAPNAPTRLNNYYQSLKAELPAVRGFQMKLETESFRNEQEFRMVFSLLVPEKDKKDAEG